LKKIEKISVIALSSVVAYWAYKRFIEPSDVQNLPNQPDTLPQSIPTYRAELGYSSPAFNTSNRSLNIKNINWLKNTYGSIIDPLCESLSLPRSVFYTVLLVESGSVAARKGFNAKDYQEALSSIIDKPQGPMQVKIITATETIQIAQAKGLLTQYHKDIINAELGLKNANLIYTKASNKIIGYLPYGTPRDLSRVNLNFTVAALKLANLIKNYGYENLHHVFYAYNQGDGSAKARGLIKYNIAQTIKNSTGEGKMYLERIYGIAGAMDIVRNNLKID
jgi:hypothetical protein